ALYRIGQREAADAVALRVEAAADRDAVSRAAFLRGLIADDAGDMAGLRAAIARIAGSHRAEIDADNAERAARLGLRGGGGAGAERPAELRRALMDYRAPARCLALAGEAAARAGDNPGAASLYLRAGRSAAAQADTPSARRWLGQAILLSRDPGLTQTARAAL